ncbi:unnamed protein product [Euphydryas editha]|uniref:Uncharacterized protein n=1 Tax=Euphydryas editha TaxID=104508 RepID=A0AAU9TFM2_EUPED|nr:unnamed protein product [Euphydryas editha]
MCVLVVQVQNTSTHKILKVHNCKSLFVPDLKNELTCFMLMFDVKMLQDNEQLHITVYLADSYNCEITICENKVKHPTPEQIPEILKTFYGDPLSGQRGILETTRKISPNIIGIV